MPDLLDLRRRYDAITLGTHLASSPGRPATQFPIPTLPTGNAPGAARWADMSERELYWHRRAVDANGWARDNGLSGYPLTGADLMAAEDVHGEGTCYLCRRVVGRKNLQIDHYTPVGHAAALHVRESVGMLCKKCNQSKSDQTPETHARVDLGMSLWDLMLAVKERGSDWYLETRDARAYERRLAHANAMAKVRYANLTDNQKRERVENMLVENLTEQERIDKNKAARRNYAARMKRKREKRAA